MNRWEPNDIPWVEHARFSPTCEFLRAKKTEFFIDQVYMDENGGHERIKNIKQDLRDYARSRGISESDISQVLSRSEPYESEDDMYSAILVLERRDQPVKLRFKLMTQMKVSIHCMAPAYTCIKLFYCYSLGPSVPLP